VKLRVEPKIRILGGRQRHLLASGYANPPRYFASKRYSFNTSARAVRSDLLRGTNSMTFIVTLLQIEPFGRDQTRNLEKGTDALLDG